MSQTNQAANATSPETQIGDMIEKLSCSNRALSSDAIELRAELKRTRLELVAAEQDVLKLRGMLDETTLVSSDRLVRIAQLCDDARRLREAKLALESENAKLARGVLAMSARPRNLLRSVGAFILGGV